MQHIIVRADRGITSTIEALGILRHFQHVYGSNVFREFRAPRDPHTKRHHGYILAVTDRATAREIVEQGEFMLRSADPATASASAQGSIDASRKQASLSDILAVMRSERPAPTSQSALRYGEEHEDGKGRVIRLTADLARPPPLPTRSLRRDGRARTSSGFATPTQLQLKRWLEDFDGFAEPGRLAPQSRPKSTPRIASEVTDKQNFGTAEQGPQLDRSP